MTRGSLLLLLTGAAAWAGAAAGALVPGPSAAWLAAAVLSALLGARGHAAGALVSVALAVASLASMTVATGSLTPLVPDTPLTGRVAGVEARPRGWLLTLDQPRGQPRGSRVRVFVPRSGVAEFDRWPGGFGPGALVTTPLKDDPEPPAGAGRPGLPRAPSCATVRVLEPPRLWQRVRGLPARLQQAFRDRARARLVTGEDDDAGAFLFATVAGDGNEISARAWRALRASGLAHLAVVSGVNVSLVVLGAAACAAPLAGADHPRRRLAALVAVLVLVALLPADPPVRRAAGAILIARAGRLVGRNASPPAALGAVTALLLAADPALAGSLSFGLTVAATAALTIASRLPARRAAWTAAFVAPTLATWPLLVAVTGRVSPFTLVANALVLPAALPALAGGWLALVLPEPAAWAAGAVARPAARWVLAVAHEVALWPGSGGLAAPAGTWWAALQLALLALALTAALRGAGRTALALAGATLVVACWPLRGCALPPPEPPGLVVLDVGQGQALLLTGAPEPVLVDAGDDRYPTGTRAALRALRARGVRRLGLLALTHADRDHSGGAPEIIAALRPRAVAVTAAALDDPALREALAEAAARGIPVRALAAGDAWRGPGAALRVLFPFPGQLGADNDRSLVLRADVGGFTAILPGDAEDPAERALARRGLLWPADVLVAGHHGARNCTGHALLARVRPRVVAISCGRGNRFGHPHPDTLRRVTRAGAGRMITAEEGSITIRAEGERALAVAGGSPDRGDTYGTWSSGTGMNDSTRMTSASSATLIRRGPRRASHSGTGG